MSSEVVTRHDSPLQLLSFPWNSISYRDTVIEKSGYEIILSNYRNLLLSLSPARTLENKTLGPYCFFQDMQSLQLSKNYLLCVICQQ